MIGDDHSGLELRGMNCIRTGFEFRLEHRYLCVGRDLATGCSPVQGVLSTVYRIKKLKNRLRPNKLL
jgi:hypothetical protein